MLEEYAALSIELSGKLTELTGRKINPFNLLSLALEELEKTIKEEQGND